jgi:hypothetical protein
MEATMKNVIVILWFILGVAGCQSNSQKQQAQQANALQLQTTNSRVLAAEYKLQSYQIKIVDSDDNSKNVKAFKNLTADQQIDALKSLQTLIDQGGQIINFSNEGRILFDANQLTAFKVYVARAKQLKESLEQKVGTES